MTEPLPQNSENPFSFFSSFTRERDIQGKDVLPFEIMRGIGALKRKYLSPLKKAADPQFSGTEKGFNKISAFVAALDQTLQGMKHLVNSSLVVQVEAGSLGVSQEGLNYVDKFYLKIAKMHNAWKRKEALKIGAVSARRARSPQGRFGGDTTLVSAADIQRPGGSIEPNPEHNTEESIRSDERGLKQGLKDYFIDSGISIDLLEEADNNDGVWEIHCTDAGGNKIFTVQIPEYPQGYPQGHDQYQESSNPYYWKDGENEMYMAKIVYADKRETYYNFTIDEDGGARGYVSSERTRGSMITDIKQKVTPRGEMK